ncbi:3-deoxy-D-arabinoheptulosonate-7-phosphate synthase [Labedaea rhizosphaerae]|uniref:Phospho-2-dehydro-3-deoxyheptonate aldolase n=2 Tax=Labedaea rhizosphaerae TaxID=598644 RepID=A0A4R6SB64_LABRH|nr:3-deoxy-D-arabinoheptulosonate-7-phosphate synthase [Labedaea rhizosphaerae]
MLDQDLLPTPAEVDAQAPLSPPLRAAIAAHRETIAAVLDRRDPRLLVIVGPCSVHDPAATLDYAHLVAGAAARFADDLVVVLRAYLEKPRTVAGWPGLVRDPTLDGKGDLAAGLRTGRAFLVEAAATGLPLAYEFVDPVLASHVADAISWAAIGARTVTSPPHRQLASWLPMPVGMKNTVGGRVDLAIDALRAAGLPHVFPGIGRDGRVAALRSSGNPSAHLVLRGGPVPNYDAASVAAAANALTEAGLPSRVVVDCSHGNSGKDHNRQPLVLADLADRIAGGDRVLAGLMLESYLSDGKQYPDAHPLRPDLSITDACLGWSRTVPLLEQLALAAKRRTAR